MGMTVSEAEVEEALLKSHSIIEKGKYGCHLGLFSLQQHPSGVYWKPGHRE